MPCCTRPCCVFAVPCCTRPYLRCLWLRCMLAGRNTIFVAAQQKKTDKGKASNTTSTSNDVRKSKSISKSTKKKRKEKGERPKAAPETKNKARRQPSTAAAKTAPTKTKPKSTKQKPTAPSPKEAKRRMKQDVKQEAGGGGAGSNPSTCTGTNPSTCNNLGRERKRKREAQAKCEAKCEAKPEIKSEPVELACVPDLNLDRDTSKGTRSFVRRSARVRRV